MRSVKSARSSPSRFLSPVCAGESHMSHRWVHCRPRSAQRAARSAQRRCCGRFVIFAGSARAGDCRQPWGLYASTSGPRALLHSAVLVPAAPGPENTQFRHFQRINDRITSPGGPNRPARSIPTPKSVPGQHGRGSLAPEHQNVRIRHPGGATTRVNPA